MHVDEGATVTLTAGDCAALVAAFRAEHAGRRADAVGRQVVREVSGLASRFYTGRIISAAGRNKPEPAETGAGSGMPAAGTPLVMGTAEIALRLGVGERRVRQLLAEVAVDCPPWRRGGRWIVPVSVVDELWRRRNR